MTERILPREGGAREGEGDTGRGERWQEPAEPARPLGEGHGSIMIATLKNMVRNIKKHITQS